MKKIILGIFSITAVAWSDVSYEEKLYGGHSMWKFEKNLKQCTTSSPSKCYELGSMYDNGKSLLKDQFKAKIFYFHACQKHFHNACKKLNEPYHQREDKTQKFSHAKIFEINKKLSKENRTVAYDLGRMYASGNGVKQNQSKAKTFYEIACHSGNAKGCLAAAYKYKKERKREKAKTLFKKACDGGERTGCNQYARIAIR